MAVPCLWRWSISSCEDPFNCPTLFFLREQNTLTCSWDTAVGSNNVPICLFVDAVVSESCRWCWEHASVSRIQRCLWKTSVRSQPQNDGTLPGFTDLTHAVVQMQSELKSKLIPIILDDREINGLFVSDVRSFGLAHQILKSLNRLCTNKRTIDHTRCIYFGAYGTDLSIIQVRPTHHGWWRY